MSNTFSYYVIAPINCLRLDFDYRMYSAEIYGCPPDYTAYPKACPEFRQPYEYLGAFSFQQYEQLISRWKIDSQTVHNLRQVSNYKLRDFTCIAFEIELDQPGYTLTGDETINSSLFQHIIDKGERFLDVWRLCLFKPGEDFSIGNFGAIDKGIQGFWLGQNDVAPKFYSSEKITVPIDTRAC